jgi:integrase
MKVTIEPFRGILRLRFDDGVRRSISMGLPDLPVGRARAIEKKNQIELDFELGYYDSTLLRYRPQTLGKNATDISAPELFDRFTKHQAKAKGLAQSGVKSRYHPIRKMLEKHLDKPSKCVTKHQAEIFAGLCEKTISSQTAKERIWLLESCWDWGKDKYQLAAVNPWKGIAQRFQVNPKQEVKPFAADELRKILEAFRQHPRYCHYSDFVSFLVNTGCRLGEAAGLRWKHLGADHSTAWIGESVSRGVRRGTKTGKAIILPSSLQSLLAERYRRIQPKDDDLVFPAPKGGAIDDQNFRPRAWAKVLELCSIEYRKPYALRHSAITHALANGANPIALAEQTGHDKRILLNTYAHVIEKEHLFIEF